MSEFSIQDTIIINRGKLAGEKGKVSAVSADGATLAVQLDNGTVLALKASQVRKPPAPMIGRDALASVIQEYVYGLDEDDVHLVVKLVQRLESKGVTGLSDAISWPAAEGEDHLRHVDTNEQGKGTQIPA